MAQIPKNVIIHCSNGSTDYLTEARIEDNCLTGHTELGIKGVRVSYPLNSVEKYVGTSKRRLERLQFLEQQRRRLLSRENISTQDYKEHSTQATASHLNPPPTSDSPQVNDWYNLVGGMRDGHGLVYHTNNEKRKYPLILDGEPDIKSDKPVVTAKLEGKKNGRYRLEIDADGGKAHIWRNEGGNLVDEKELTKLILIPCTEISSTTRVEFAE